MTLNCEEIVRRYASEVSDRFECHYTSGHLRVITPYLYSNNDFIEVFVEELSPTEMRVTDLGETFRHLYSQGFDVTSRTKRRDMAEIIASRTNVSINHGQLAKTGTPEDIGELIFDLIVAARGVSDLVYTARTLEPATFKEEIGQFLIEHNMEFDMSTKLTGGTGRIYTVDFHLRLPDIYIQTLSPRRPSGIRGQVNATFRMWYDCNGDLSRERKLSLLNDVGMNWKEDDRALLNRVSTVFAWSRSDELVTALANFAN